MTRTRWLIVLFWVFVGVMLLKQCHDYTEKQIKEGEANPPRQYFFTPPPYTAPPATPGTPAQAIRQTAFTTQESTPGTGSFTCFVTLRNDGQLLAHNIQVRVRPYRGVKYGTDAVGHVGFTLLTETDPLSQFGSWITFSDLKPGESSTQSVIFLDHPNIEAGYNPQPEITFETTK